MNQSGFDFASGIGFDTGHGQAGFDFSQPESQHSKDERERRRRNERETAERAKREREQQQREERRRREEQRRYEPRGHRSVEDPYVVLGIGYNATTREIRLAWVAKIRGVHPDIGGDTAEAQRINRAYEALKGRR